MLKRGVLGLIEGIVHGYWSAIVKGLFDELTTRLKIPRNTVSLKALQAGFDNSIAEIVMTALDIV